MKRSRPFRFAAAAAACLGLILPEPILLAARPSGDLPPHGAPIGDVQLDSQGTLTGIVINVEGAPVAGVAILVRRADRDIARTTTDATGCFVVPRLSGGVYELIAGRYARPYRTWAAHSAPPKTSQAALIVVGHEVVRGQRPLGQVLGSDLLLGGVLLGAAIAIPVAIHGSQRHRPSSP